MNRNPLGKFTYQDSRGERADVLPNVNRSALAREMGCSRSQLSRILNGRIEPPLKMVRKLAAAMNMTMDEVDQFLKGLKNKKRRSGK